MLIFFIACNADTAIEKFLARIPVGLQSDNVEVLIIDDSSPRDDSAGGIAYQQRNSAFKVTVLRTPENQGWGGKQKLGYRYAIDNNFDIVALLCSDVECAPEKLPDFLELLIRDEADAVFGSRVLERHAPRGHGMPFSKRKVNRAVIAFQNQVMGSRFSEFDSGYRVYSTKALAQIPFERNTDDFHFDAEIVIQFKLKKLRIAGVPVAISYGDEICRTNRLRYAWNVMKSVVRAQLCNLHLFYDRKFDVRPLVETYTLKLGFPSSHTAAIAAARPGGNLLDVGCGQGYVAAELTKKGCRVTGMDRHIPAPSQAPQNVDFIRWDLDRNEFPVNVSQFDQIFLLDIIEHLKDPGHFMDELRFATDCKRPEIVLTTANIGFIVTRLMLLLGQFNYGKKGILDVTHTRLFTFRSMRELLKQSGYEILHVDGIPAPFPVALGNNFFARALVRLNTGLIRLSKGLFAYQILIRAEAKPTVNNLLRQTISGSSAVKSELIGNAA